MSLYPTKTRLALLQAVAEGDIQRDGRTDRWMDARVNARIAELAHEGWVRLGAEIRTRQGAGTPRLWLVTPAGRAILDGGGES